MEFDDVAGGAPNGGRNVLLFDIHVERVEEQAGVFGADVSQELKTLVDRIDEIRFETVQRLDRQPDRALRCISRTRLEACDGARPLGRALTRVQHSRGADCGVHRPGDEGAAESRSEVNAALEIGEPVPPHRRVFRG